MMIRWAMSKLFGVQYAIFRYGFGSEIRKIRTAPDGTKYVICYGDYIEEGKRGWKRIL